MHAWPERYQCSITYKKILFFFFPLLYSLQNVKSTHKTISGPNTGSRGLNTAAQSYNVLCPIFAIFDFFIPFESARRALSPHVFSIIDSSFYILFFQSYKGLCPPFASVIRSYKVLCHRPITVLLHRHSPFTDQNQCTFYKFYVRYVTRWVLDNLSKMATRSLLSFYFTFSTIFITIMLAL